MTDHHLGRQRPKEAGEQAPQNCHHVGYAQSTTDYPANGGQATCLHHSETQTIPTRGFELDDSTGKDSIQGWVVGR